MKSAILSLFLLLLCNLAFALKYKATGGCGMICSIDSILPCSSPNLMFNGSAYSVFASFGISGCDNGWGDLEITMGGIIIGKLSGLDVMSNDRLTIPLSTLSLPPGSYTMKLVFNDSYCGKYSAYKQIVVKDPPAKDTTTSANNTTASQPQRTPAVTPRAELAIYPVPASDIIYIDGLKTTETEYQLHITNMQGSKVSIKDVTRTSYTVTIPVKELPEGIYFVHLQTASRSIMKRVQIVR